MHVYSHAHLNRGVLHLNWVDLSGLKYQSSLVELSLGREVCPPFFRICVKIGYDFLYILEVGESV